MKHLAYDNLRRAIGSSWDGNVGPSVATAYDAASRITSITTNSGETTLAFGYDNANRKIWEDQTVSGYPTRRVQTPRDADGNRTNLEMYSNGVINYGVYYDYTQRNQLWHIYWNSNQMPWFSYSYDAAGNMTKRQDAYAGVNDSTNAPSNYYDALNRPTMWENTGSGDVPFARSWYQYDNVGRQVATWRDEQSSKGERFDYSSNDQLTVARYNAEQVWTGNPLNAARRVDYSYSPDTLNRSSVTDNGIVTTYGNDGMNQVTLWGGQSIAYDSNFNFSWIGGWVYSYDADKRLTGLSNPGPRASFVYDGLGRCVKRTINGVMTVINYDGWKPIMEWDSPTHWVAWNAYGAGPDEILWRQQAGVGHLRYHSDIHGNVTALLDVSGNVIETYSYDTFGKPTITDRYGNVNGSPHAVSSVGNRFMFQGREYFGEIGLIDFRNRFYDPALGRFLQSDPTGFGGDPSNLYRYCGNNPINRGDPSGLGIPPFYKPNTDYQVPGVVVDGGSWDPFGIEAWGGGVDNIGLDPAFGSGGWGRGNWGALAGSYFLGRPLGSLSPQAHFSALDLSPPSSTDPNVDNPDLAQNPFNGVSEVTATEFGGVHSAYGPYDKNGNGPIVDPNALGASLPYRFPSANAPPNVTVGILNLANGRSVTAPIKDVGPWNTTNNYWSSGNAPLAVTQFANGLMGQNGQLVTNPGGIDLTPATMNALGVSGGRYNRQAEVIWWFH